MLLTQWGKSIHNVYVYQTIMLYSLNVILLANHTSIGLGKVRGKRPKSKHQNFPAPLFILSPRQFILEYHIFYFLLSFLTGVWFHVSFIFLLLHSNSNSSHLTISLGWVVPLFLYQWLKRSIHACLRELRRRPKREKKHLFHIYIILD